MSFVDSKQFDFVCSIGAKTQPESKCPELLANYCDMLLRKTPLSKKLTSEEVEKKLRDVVCKDFYFRGGYKYLLGISGVFFLILRLTQLILSHEP